MSPVSFLNIFEKYRDIGDIGGIRGIKNTLGIH